MRVWWSRCAVLACMLLAGGLLLAQTTGSITGTVSDASGAVVPGATVTLKNEAQGWTRTATTNGDGAYLFGGLAQGDYDVTVTAHGFQRYQANGVRLTAAQNMRNNITLQVGAVSRTVEVSGVNVGQVQLTSGTLSTTVTSKQVTELQLNGRSFNQLITLSPGVEDGDSQTQQQAVGVYGGVTYHVNGGRASENNWEVDGVNVQDNGSNTTINVYPSIDAIGQVKVLTSNYGAQYGRDANGTILVETKSGTNQWHGDAYEFLRNQALNARSFFDAKKPVYRKNDYGFTIGGPIRKNKTFIFWSEEWRKESNPVTFNQQVPSLAERQGNFADVCPAAGATVTSANQKAFPVCPIDPTTGAYYPNYTVPISTNAQDLLPLIPTPTTGSGANSYDQASVSEPTNWREEMFRIDQQFGAKNHVYYQFIHDSWNTVVYPTLWDSGYNTVGTNFAGPGVAMMAHWTTVLSPTLVNDFVAGYTADHIDLTDFGPISLPSNFQIPGIYNNGFGGKLPGISVNSMPYGNTISTGDEPWTNSNPTYIYRDQVTQVIGNHNLYWGGEFDAAQKNEANNKNNVQGFLTFNSGWAGSTGNGLADMYIGAVQNYSQTNLQTRYYDRYKTGDLFIQDDWHARPNLTLDLGLQLDLLGNYYDIQNSTFNFNPAGYSAAAFPGYNANGSLQTTTPFTSGIISCGNPSCQGGHLFNWAPRLGFSWDPTGTGTMAIRGGYGIFYDHTNSNSIVDQLRNPPAYLSSNLVDISGYQNISGAGSVEPLTLSAVPMQQRWPMVQQWNLDVQKQLPGHFVATVAYVGNAASHLAGEYDLNAFAPLAASQNPFAPGQPLTTADCTAFSNSGTLANGTAVGAAAQPYMTVACGGNANFHRPYPGYGSINYINTEFNSNYNALQVTAERDAGPLDFSLAYTWSHALDYTSTYGAASFFNPYNPGLSYANASFDQPQNLTMSWVYNLPFFARNKWAGGWTWSGIFTALSGTPFTPTIGISPANNLGTGASYFIGATPTQVMANNASSASAAGVPVTTGPQFYNPAAFSINQGLTYGNVGRNALFNPGFWNFDMALYKNFHVTESQNVQFRWEAFNVFNNVQWSGLNTSINCVGSSNNAGAASCFGSNGANNTLFRPSGARLGRVMELALKYQF